MHVLFFSVLQHQTRGVQQTHFNGLWQQTHFNGLWLCVGPRPSTPEHCSIPPDREMSAVSISTPVKPEERLVFLFDNLFGLFFRFVSLPMLVGK